MIILLLSELAPMSVCQNMAESACIQWVQWCHRIAMKAPNASELSH